MRAAIFNPYLDTLGGGERYTMAFAKVLSDSGWEVSVQWKNPEIKKQLEDRFGIDLAGIKFIEDIKKGDGYDLCFWVSDGSIPLLRARRNLLHFQVPFHRIGGNNLLNKMKLIRIDKIICNSNFTKKIIDHEYGVDSIVIYPAVDTAKIVPKRKENIILNVSRFSGLLQNKGQNILIDTFKQMVDSRLTEWKLILAGGIEIGTGEFIKELTESSKNYPVSIVKSPNFKTLKDLYGKSKIFWSAAGFEANEEENPEKTEHFGITVVESMAAGAVPIIYSAGGHKEIITDGVNGFLWHNTQELADKTKTVIRDRMQFVRNAESSSKKYSYDEFRKNITEIL